MARKFWLAGSAVLVALAGACSGEGGGPPVRTDDATSATTSVPTTAAAHSKASDVVKRYFEAFATDLPQAMAAMLELSAPDSPAHTYARFQTASIQVAADQGRPPEPRTLELTGDAIRICTTRTEVSPGVEPCLSFSDFTAAPGSELLTGFMINGKPIQDRLVKGGDIVSAGGARFTLVVGYQSIQSETLLLVVEIVNGPKKISIFSDSATYVGANGRQVKASGAEGPFEVQPSASASVVIGFAGATPHGRLILEGYDGSSKYEVSFPVS